MKDRPVANSAEPEVTLCPAGQNRTPYEAAASERGWTKHLLGSAAGKIHRRQPLDLLHRAPGLGGKFKHLLSIKDMSDPYLA